MGIEGDVCEGGLWGRCVVREVCGGGGVFRYADHTAFREGLG